MINKTITLDNPNLEAMIPIIISIGFAEIIL